jgi:5'-3' exonuclease
MTAHDYDAVLVDFSWLVARSFYAHSGLSVVLSEAGETREVRTGDLYGTLDAISGIVTAAPDAKVLLCVDSKNDDGTYTTKSGDSGYKAGREAGKACFEKYGLILSLACEFPNTYAAEIPGAEADEVITTMADYLSGLGKRSMIFSRDKDLCQAVGPLVEKSHAILGGTFADPMGPEEVREKMGVLPGSVPMMQAIVGDSIDGVRKYPRFWAKHAAAIASRFPDPDSFFSRNGDELPPRVERQAEKLDDWEDQLRNNYKLTDMGYFSHESVRFTRPLLEDSGLVISRYRLFKFKDAISAAKADSPVVIS